MHHEQALQIKSDNAKVHNDLGLIYGKSGKHRDAINAFKDAILKNMITQKPTII